MVSWNYYDIVSCEYCGKKATVVFIRSSLFSLNNRMFCKECAIKHRRVRDDTNANHW